jgi:predicted Zn-dependent protease
MVRTPLVTLVAALSPLTAMCGGGGAGSVASSALQTDSYLDGALDPDHLFRWTPIQPAGPVEILVEVQNAAAELPQALTDLGYGPQECAEAVRDGLASWAKHTSEPLAFALSFHEDGALLDDDVVKIEVSFLEGAAAGLEGYTRVVTEQFRPFEVSEVVVEISIGADVTGLSGDMVYALLLHELGHALGIVAPAPRTGHSPDTTDVMFPTVRWLDLSKEDRLAIRELYELEPTMRRSDEAAAGPDSPHGGSSGGGLWDRVHILFARLESLPARPALQGGGTVAPRCAGCAGLGQR